MRRVAAPFAAIALLAAGLFAAVSIAQGGGLIGITTFGTTGLTTTANGKVVICHRTGSLRHPFHAIVVAVPAVRAHLAHGDALGPCTVATIGVMRAHGRGRGPLRHSTTTTTTTTSAAAPTSAPTHGNSGTHGNGNAGGNGNGNAGGNGHGNGRH